MNKLSKRAKHRRTMQRQKDLQKIKRAKNKYRNPRPEPKERQLISFMKVA